MIEVLISGELLAARIVDNSLVVELDSAARVELSNVVYWTGHRWRDASLRFAKLEIIRG